MKPTRRTADRLEDFDLIRHHESPERICERLGVTPRSFARLLQRHGRTEQARPFVSLYRAQQRARRASAPDAS